MRDFLVTKQLWCFIEIIAQPLVGRREKWRLKRKIVGTSQSCLGKDWTLRPRPHPAWEQAYSWAVMETSDPVNAHIASLQWAVLALVH